MYFLRRLLLSLPWVRCRRETSVDDELGSHMALAAEEMANAGIPVEEAQFAAKREMGNALQIKERVRREWLVPGLEQVMQDIRYTGRTLKHTPLFTLVALFTLALGIGATTAIFSLVEGVLLKPLKYPEADRLVYVQEHVPAMAHLYPAVPVNLQHFFYWHDHSTSFESIGALRSNRPTLTGAGEPTPIEAVETTTDLFRVLRIQMAQGRSFVSGEDLPANNNVAVVTDSFWRHRLGSASGVVGKRIVLDGVPITVIGVLPRDFTFPRASDLGQLAGLGESTEIFCPLQGRLQEWDGDYDYICFGRLKSGIAAEQALVELKALTGQLIRAYGVESQPRPLLHRLQDVIVGPVRRSFLVLLCAVAALLLIVCVNLANLILARSNVRSREYSIRTALGAGQARLIQQMITEAGLLSLAGGGLGIAFAGAAIKLLVRSADARLPRLDEVSIDGRVVCFALCISAACALVCGLVPALRVVRSDPQDALKSGTTHLSSSKQALRFRGALIGFEVALSTTLLFLSGLLISSVFHLLHVEKGFTAEQALAIDLALPELRYPSVRDRNLFFDRLLTAVRVLPGVDSAAMVLGLPLTGETQVNGIELDKNDQPWYAAAKTDAALINVRFISSDYFATLGIPLLKGRAMGEADMKRRVTVVSARLADKVWHGKDPLGKKFKTGSRVGQVEVIGVVRDVHNGRLDQDPTMIAYVPYSLRGPTYGSLVVRTTRPADVLPAVKRSIWSLDASLPAPAAFTMAQLVDRSVAARRFQMLLAVLFGAGALCLALIGIYGIVAYNVAARRTEVGIRLALGATRSKLVALMMWRGLEPTLIGLAIGLIASLACGWLVRDLLFGVHFTDRLTIASVAMLLLLTGFLACFVPAAGVSRMDPGSSLRYE